MRWQRFASAEVAVRFTLALLLLVVPSLLHAQFLSDGARSFPDEEIIPAPNGYLGVARDGDVVHLTGYDGRLAYRGTRSYRPLHISDVALFGAPVANVSGILLGGSGPSTALYRILLSGDAPPLLQPIREGDLPRLGTIVSAGPITRGGPARLALHGDTTFVLLDVTGGVIYSYSARVLDAVFDPSPPSRFVLAVATSTGREIQWLDAESGRLLSRRRIEAGGRIELQLHDDLIVLSTTPPFYCTVIDRASTRLIDTIRLESRALAVFDRGTAENRGPVALVGGYPSPRLVPLLGEEPPVAIDYPLRGTIDQAVALDGLVVTLSGDSIAAFDLEMTLLGRRGAGALSAPVGIVALDSTALLLSSHTGSELVHLKHTTPGWIERNWEKVAIGITALLLLAALVAALRRYLFIRSIYNNLVGGRGSGGILVITGSQRVRHINRAARSMLDIAGYIPMGRHVREYLTEEDFRPVIELLRRLFSTSTPFEIRIDRTLGSGSKSYAFRGRPMFGRYGFTAGFLLLVDDVTESIAQERLVNWASVAHHIAHEMKTPLGTVRVTAEMLRDRLGSNGSVNDELRATTRIIRQAERLRSIVDDLLTVARTESLRKVGADLGLLVPSMAHEYLEYLPPGVELHLAIEGEDFTCHIDVAQVTVALRNLLDNARHAIGTRAGGRIDLAMRAEEERISVVVRDNGVGMGPATLARLFQPFYTEREGGSGIGTIIIKRVIEGHGGTIEVESAEGVGTTFTVSLPRG